MITREMEKMFAENLRITNELEAKILADPEIAQPYLHMRWHTTHPGEICPMCETCPTCGTPVDPSRFAAGEEEGGKT